MVFPLLSLGLAVVLIYFTLLVHPQPLPAPPPAPSVLPPPPPPPPPRLQRGETPLRNRKSDPVSSPLPPKKETKRQHHKLHTKNNHRTPPPSKEKLNLGKKIGLLFTGVAAVLQVCVIAFLVVKSRKMFKNQSSH
ncbi:hypothetical protein AG4045_001452 [Apium graveolens]|uniref:Uncharacterized protein n=1 Tax=Apium graveolens TaxID=4045 RepID=A0A6L5BA64_APIGR|nr:hypothetical protein AG4045_001452 [Apium graveolens]